MSVKKTIQLVPVRVRRGDRWRTVHRAPNASIPTRRPRPAEEGDVYLDTRTNQLMIYKTLPDIGRVWTNFTQEDGSN